MKRKYRVFFSLGLPRKGQEFLLNPLKPQSVTGKSPVYLLTVLIILSVFRMFFSYFAPLVLVFYDDDVGSPLELFVCLGFDFDLSSRPSLGICCNSCGGDCIKNSKSKVVPPEPRSSRGAHTCFIIKLRMKAGVFSFNK